MLFKIQIAKKNIRKQSAQPMADNEKYMHDNYVKVGQISLYNEKKIIFIMTVLNICVDFA